MKRAALILISLLLAACIAGCGGALPDSPGFPTVTEPVISTMPPNNSYMPEPTAMIRNFVVLSQLPELPTGCEITSLTMTLNYYGVAADKCDLADNWLKKGEIDASDYREVFVGDPRSEEAYGCYAPVIVDTANRYLKSKKSKLRAKDLSGTEFTGLLSYIDKGVPVIVWGTEGCHESYYSESWFVGDDELYWLYPEHCMVLLGYSEFQVWVGDPLSGAIKAFDRVLFECRYDEVLQQAVIIQ